MKIDLNKEYETRDGREVKLFHIMEDVDAFGEKL